MCCLRPWAWDVWCDSSIVFELVRQANSIPDAEMKVLVFTFIPSPYQVELFDAIAESGEVHLTVVYVESGDPSRPWAERRRRHAAVMLGDLDWRRAKVLVDDASISVFSWYRVRLLRDLMSYCARAGKVWSFWGEAPGARSSGIMGRMARRVALRPLHRTKAPIWGIGQWAVERYRNEFSSNRRYTSIPYFSDLAR